VEFVLFDIGATSALLFSYLTIVVWSDLASSESAPSLISSLEERLALADLSLALTALGHRRVPGSSVI